MENFENPIPFNPSAHLTGDQLAGCANSLRYLFELAERTDLPEDDLMHLSLKMIGLSVVQMLKHRQKFGNH